MILNNKQLQYLVIENYLYLKEDESDSVEIEVLKNEYESSGRHQEYWDFVFKYNDKYYSVGYSVSVKDSMGWDECNYGPHECIEVEPYTETIIKYKPVKK